MKNGKTIRIFLPDGDPKGIKKAEITTNKIEIIQSSRKDFNENKSKHFEFRGIYILVDSVQEDKPKIYIGKGNVKERITIHNNEKDFWNLIFAIRLTTETGFNDSHLSYLEHYFIKRAEDLQLSKKDNEQQPTLYKLDEPTECDLKHHIETITILLATLGLKIFQEPDNSKKIKFHIENTAGAIGDGEYTKEGFVVLKGSKFKKKYTDSSTVKNIIMKLENNGYLKDDEKDNAFYILIQDYTFSSPSAAACLITGCATNGWNTWKTTDKKTLDDIYRRSKK